MTKLAAIIPAAGFSSRMGRLKPLLSLGGGTMLSRCVDLFRANDVERIFVVTGNRAKEVGAAAERAGAVAVHNAGFEQGMFSSVLTGVKALPDDVTGFFVLPVDIPLVRRETVARIIKVFKRTKPAILYPRFLGERGHPPLISRTLEPDILSHDGSGGLRTVLERRDADAGDLDVADGGTVCDLDNPADYERALSPVDKGFPTDEECDQLWEMYDVPETVIAHCRAVSRVGEALCDRLNRRGRGCPLDPAMVRGAALTHDIGKGTRHHEVVGEERLREHGFPFAAEVALEHFDMSLGPDEPVAEREVVFLADKLVRGVKPVPLESRYLEKIELFGHEPDVKQAILGRLERARAMLARFDREMGISAEQVAREVLG